MIAPRVEYKYRIDEATASAVRDYVSAYLEPDPHVVDRTTNEYPVNNLYLDSDDLKTYWRAINNTATRYKLRVRSYSDAPDSPVFLEIKRRVHDQTIKTRGAIRREALDPVIAGELPTAEDLYWSTEEHLRAVLQFVEHLREIEARPRAHVRYLREAWVSRDSEALRLTMDRDIRVAPNATTQFLTADLADPTRPFGDAVVLEIKISGPAPLWFVDLEQTAGLRRGSAAKYCDGVLTRGEHHFSSRYAPPDDLDSLLNVATRRQKLQLPPSTLPDRAGLQRKSA